MFYEDDPEKKRAFAYELLKHGNHSAAARSVFPDHGERCYNAELLWPDDPEVLKFKRELLEQHGEEHFLPSKTDVARLAFQIARTALEDKDKVSALKFYSELMGFTGDGAGRGTNVNVNILNAPTVDRPPRETIEEWRARIAREKGIANAGDTAKLITGTVVPATGATG